MSGEGAREGARRAPRLPGGAEERWRVLLEWLSHVDRKSPTQAEMVAWALTHHGRATSGLLCDRGLEGLGAMQLVRFDAGVVRLTPAGRRLLRTRDRAFLLAHSLATTDGLDEILELAGEGWWTADDVLAGLRARGLGPGTATQVQGRLEWLMACGVAERYRGRWRIVR